MSPTEIAKLQQYMQGLFGNERIAVKPRPQKSDSAEVYVGEEFVGVLFQDPDDPEDYNFNMSILGVDLEGAGGSA
jgi:hypothetical protein